MKRIWLLIFLICPAVSFSQTQLEPKKTSISVEGGGTGIISSANIARTLYVHKRFKIIAQAGLGINPKEANSTQPFNIPLQVTNCFGKNKIRFEAGLGATLILNTNLNQETEDIRSNEVYLSPIIGFRYESKKWFARAYGSPLFLLTGEHIRDEVTRNALGAGIGIDLIL